MLIGEVNSGMISELGKERKKRQAKIEQGKEQKGLGQVYPDLCLISIGIFCTFCFNRRVCLLLRSLIYMYSFPNLLVL